MQLFSLQKKNVLLRETKTNAKQNKTVILSMLMANYLELYRLHGSSIPLVSPYKSEYLHTSLIRMTA